MALGWVTSQNAGGSAHRRECRRRQKSDLDLSAPELAARDGQSKGGKHGKSPTWANGNLVNNSGAVWTVHQEHSETGPDFQGKSDGCSIPRWPLDWHDAARPRNGVAMMRR